jgi:hypothetical protein
MAKRSASPFGDDDDGAPPRKVRRGPLAAVPVTHHYTLPGSGRVYAFSTRDTHKAARVHALLSAHAQQHTASLLDALGIRTPTEEEEDEGPRQEIPESVAAAARLLLPMINVYTDWRVI